MDAVLLAVCSAALFGAMTVALRFALADGASAEVGAVLTIIPALGVALCFAAADSIRDGAPDLSGIWVFALAGIIGPGGSQVLFTLAVRDAGPSRTSVLVGTAPLFSVVFAVTLLSEPLDAALTVGAVLIVTGGLLLAGERVRPEHFKAVGLAYALGATVLFASRDTLLRWLSLDTDVPSSFAAAATLASGTLCVLAFAVFTRPGRRAPLLAGWRTFALAGLCFGLSYVSLFAAYYRGRVTVVSPLIATESLWGVLFSALLLRHSERIGRRLVGGALLIVAGGALIGALR